MMDAAKLKTMQLRDLTAGDALFAVGQSWATCLVASINTFPVFIILDGEKPFHVGDLKAARASGIKAPKVVFRVEPTEASRCAIGDFEAGQLILDGERLGITGTDRHDMDIVVWLGSDGSQESEDAVFFKKWEMGIEGQAGTFSALFTTDAA